MIFVESHTDKQMRKICKKGLSVRKIGYHDVLPLDLGLFLSQFLCLNLQAEIKKAKSMQKLLPKNMQKPTKIQPIVFWTKKLMTIEGKSEIKFKTVKLQKKSYKQ